MARFGLEKLTLPGLIAIGAASAALAIGGAGATPAPQSGLQSLDAADYASHAATLFVRADVNDDNAIDAREFHALSIITAELSRLNGSVSLSMKGTPNDIPIAYSGPASLSFGERARIEAITAQAFYRAAGADNLIDADEFIGFEMERFADADRNADGVLAQSELARLGAKTAHLTETQA